MITVDEKMLVHEFNYFEYVGEDRFHSPVYADPQNIKKCRIDVEVNYAKDHEQVSSNLFAIIFCFTGFTSPLPDFKKGSRVDFFGESRTIERVIPLAMPYSERLFGYELEVI